MNKFFTIIGGMGTQATESYIHLINKLTPATCDQDYLNYILLNHATIPDRTAYILNHKNPNPAKVLIKDIKQQNKLHPEFYTLPCNTAHYFFNALRQYSRAPILNMPQETVKYITNKYGTSTRVGLIATKGTIEDKIYDKAFQHTTLRLIKPTNKIENKVMHLIYKDVKAKNYCNVPLYKKILGLMYHQLNCQVVLLGCTELSLIQERYHLKAPVVDAQLILAKNTVKLAEKLQKRDD